MSPSTDPPDEDLTPDPGVGHRGPNNTEIERIANELRASLTGEPATSSVGDCPVPSGHDTGSTSRTGVLAPVRDGAKKIVRKAVGLPVRGLAIDVRRISAELDRRERVRPAERAEYEATISELRRELSAVRDRLGRLERGRLDAAPNPTVATAPQATSVPTDGSFALDYFAFEALLRGSTEEIAERQAAYLPLLEGIDNVLDIGCGRGELLELLTASGRRARGIDLDADMVAKCVERGLDVQHGDGVAYLSTLPVADLGGIVALQVVEHLRPATLIAFLAECHRTIRPGGLLLLETINPVSLSALRNYFADLTHAQPLIPETLAFLAESAGFHEVRIDLRSPLPEIARLRHIPYGKSITEATQAESDRNVDLINAALFGPQDFSLVARA